MINNVQSKAPGSSFNVHQQYGGPTLQDRLKQGIRIEDASYLQQQMNNSRFGGFRTADANKSVVPGSNNPTSPQSNDSYRMGGEQRRARPKIVKTSQDHGNMFFIQQANSMKNSSQISQRKDIAKHPFQYTKSRGADSIS